MAADSILEVLLKFSGDSSHARGEIEKLTKSQKKEAEEQKKKIEDVRKAWANASNEIVNIGKKIAGAFTATGAAMIAIAKNAANYGDEILTASQKTGESVKNLSQLAYAAKIGETSLDGLVSGMGLLSRKMAEAADGNDAAAKSFNDLGIPIKNADGSLRSATDVMLDFADVAATTKDNTRLTAQAMELFGRSGAELIPFLKMGKTGISELMAEADRLGLTLTDKAARAGDAFNDSLTKMNGALQGARNAIGTSLLPILTQYIEKMSAWIAANREVIAQKVTEFFQAFISVAKVLVGVIEKLRGAWMFLVAAFAGFKIASIITAFSKFKDAIGGLSKPMQEGISKWAKFGGAAVLAATVATVAINALFDHLNDRLDEAEKRTQQQVKFQGDMETRLRGIQSGLRKDLGMTQEGWQKFMKSIGAFGKPMQEQYRLLNIYANNHKDAISESIKKNAELAKQSSKLAKEIGTAGTAITKTGTETKKAAGNTKEYEDLLESLSKQTLKSLNAQFDAYKKILDEVREGTIQLSEEAVKDLVGNLIKLGEETKRTGEIGEEYLSKYFDEFIDKAPQFKKIAVDDLNPGIEEQVDLYDQIRAIAIDITDEILRWAPSIGNALSSLGLMTDDMAALLSGVEGAATGIGKIATGDLTGILDVVASLPDLIDGLTESTQEGYVKQFEKQGFDDEYSQELLDKMSEVSDAMGDKSYGIKAYIEDFFAETDISNAEEFSRMSDLLSESINEYIAQGHTADEAYEKFGDELEQLTDAQEEYGFETTESLKAMLTLQKQQTKEGRVSGYTDVVKNLENVITGMSAYGFSQESWNSVFGMFQDAFKRLQSEGLSMQEIQAIIGPTMEKAMKIAEEQGLDTSSIEQLKSFYEKMSGAGGLLDVIAGLQGAVSGLADTGSLTQENISQSATAAMETYQKLLNEGFTENEALQQMGSLLGEISSSAEQYGYSIPEELANLVTAAEGIGAIQIEKPLDQTLSDGLVEGFDRVVEIMKGFYSDLPAFARGGIVRTAEGDETVATVHDGEYVLAADAVRRIGINTIDAVNNNGIMPTTYVPIVTDNTPVIEQQMQEAVGKMENQQAQFMATVGGEIAKSIKEGIAAAMPNAGKTMVNTNVSLNGSAILKFLETAMNNGSLTINANAIRVK